MLPMDDEMTRRHADGPRSSSQTSTDDHLRMMLMGDVIWFQPSCMIISVILPNSPRTLSRSSKSPTVSFPSPYRSVS